MNSFCSSMTERTNLFFRFGFEINFNKMVSMFYFFIIISFKFSNLLIQCLFIVCTFEWLIVSDWHLKFFYFNAKIKCWKCDYKVTLQHLL